MNGFWWVMIAVVVLAFLLSTIDGQYVGKTMNCNGTRVRVIAADRKTNPTTYIVQDGYGREYRVTAGDLRPLR